MPQSGQDVPDDLDARLVVLRSRASLQQGAGQRGRDGRQRRSSSRAATRRASTATRWSSSRPTRRACRTSTRRRAKYLAWESILAEKEALNLDPAAGQAGRDPEDAGRRRRHGAHPGDLPVAAGAGAEDAPGRRSSGRRSGSPPARTRWRCARARSSGTTSCLLTVFAGTRLRMELDRVPLWRGDHVAVKQLAEDFARYLYLPRLKDVRGLDGGSPGRGRPVDLGSQETFAFADSFDEAAGRYRGLRGGVLLQLSTDDLTGLLVRSEIARKQIEAEVTPAPTTPGNPRPELPSDAPEHRVRT